MRIDHNLLTVGVCGLALGLFARAQGRKAGLWEVTATMTFQQSPFPEGMMQMGSGPRTTQVCVTKEQIEKFGTVPPHSPGNCKIADVVKKANSMTAEMICAAPYSGKGEIASSWSDDSHSTSKVHFVGEMQMGEESKPIEWTVESTSVYKGADCGSVKPLPTN